MFINIDRNSNISIKKQLYDKLTYMILNCELMYGEKLPSSRELASSLKISRNTVVEVYDQLIAEVYISTRKGSGTYVTNTRKCHLLEEPECSTKRTKKDPNILRLIAGTPDLTHFPKQSWMQATRRAVNNKNTDIFGYGDPNGYLPLREALSKYLYTHKGICSSPEQVIISGGTKDAIRLIALSLKDEINSLLTESPSVLFVPEIFRSIGYNITPLKVDSIGIVTKELKHQERSIIYTSAAHQFPLGGTLTIKRRHELIDFAVKHNHLIIEDDCDSEFRYKGAPVNSLFQICSRYVIHIGTFSKTICPSLRLGYIVLPEILTAIPEKYTELIGNPPGTLLQATVNDLIRSGDYEKHIFKMTKIYKAKVKIVIDTLNKEFSNKIRVNGEHTGLHVVVEFINHTFKESDKAVFYKYNLEVEFSNEYSTGRAQPKSNKLIFNFAHLTQDEIILAITQLKNVYRALTN